MWGMCHVLMFVLMYSICTPVFAHRCVREDVYVMWSGQVLCSLPYPKASRTWSLPSWPVHICVCCLAVYGLSPVTEDCIPHPTSHKVFMGGGGSGAPCVLQEGGLDTR